MSSVNQTVGGGGLSLDSSSPHDNMCMDKILDP